MPHYKFVASTPHLPVRQLQETLAYYRDILGFSNEWIFGDKDGGISRDQLRMLFTEDANFTIQINNEFNRLAIIWFVENIEQVYKDFKSSNIKLADDLRQHSYGAREFAFIDINGYYIRISETFQGNDT